LAINFGETKKQNKHKSIGKKVVTVTLLFLLLSTGLASFAQAETYNFVTKWGSQGSGQGQFVDPFFLKVDNNGFVYVTDNGGHRVEKFTSTGEFVTAWGSFGSGDGQFTWPSGIAVDDEGFVYVAERGGNDRIQKFTSDGVFITKWGSSGSGEGQFDHPLGITVDNSGFLYVDDTNNQRIQKFTTDGVFVTAWGSFGSGDGQFNYPNDVGVDSEDFVYVADYLNHRVQKFTSDGTFVSKWGSFGSAEGQFHEISVLAIDNLNNIYVTDDTFNNRVQKFTNNGVFVITWGSSGSGDGQFLNPFGIDVDTSGFVYVLDRSNYRVQKFSSTMDTVPPSLNVNCPAEYGVYSANSEQTYDFTATDNMDPNPTITATIVDFQGNSVLVHYGDSLPTSSGVYSLTVTATDAAGLSSSELVLFVVYDQNAGFVTGGGWFNSPAGAYASNPSLAGKATFGFESKYQKGANVPTGQTQFQFKVGNLNFHSTSYDWLVVGGAKAQYKGIGTINGEGTYGFMLTAIDGQLKGNHVDTFRIKIWDITTGAIVYDNQMGTSDSGDPTTAISGGSIIIHK
jgi:hypothetical protein